MKYFQILALLLSAILVLNACDIISPVSEKTDADDTGAGTDTEGGTDTDETSAAATFTESVSGAVITYSCCD